MPVHPLLLQPIYQRKVWGGRRLADLFGRELPAGESIGESWECSDLPRSQSVVARVPSRGKTLTQLMGEWGADLTGRAALCEGRFPLLLKFLDCREPLSIQVHPGARTSVAQRLRVPPKHEAWYVIDAASDAFAYLGHKPGVTREQVAAAALDGTLAEMLNRVPLKAGHCLYCPGGTLRTLGGGAVVAEVQTPCDVTYRLYDWGRTRPADDAGLQLSEAMACIEWDAPPRPAEAQSHTGGLFTTVTRMLRCAAFNVERVRFSEGMDQELPYAEMVLWMVLQGRGSLVWRGGEPISFRAGDTLLLPAALKGARLRTETDCVWLEITVPIPSDLASLERPAPDGLRDDEEKAGGGLVQLGLLPKRSQ